MVTKRLDLLDEPIEEIRKEWRTISVDEIIPYLQQYQPSDEKLSAAKTHLVRTYDFIKNLNDSGLDEHMMLKEFDVSTAGKWFDQHIVQQYYDWNLKRI
ncbi:hypothetical protein MHTCC0001_32600 [Flavobacteriaceae bacterium MHTCC 0001]